MVRLWVSWLAVAGCEPECRSGEGTQQRGRGSYQGNDTIYDSGQLWRRLKESVLDCAAAVARARRRERCHSVLREQVGL